ncbi:MAG: hypothetical protein WCT51_02015 [Candidatus Shapirobacteria bacterium]|jgi:hypothetical protein
MFFGFLFWMFFIFRPVALADSPSISWDSWGSTEARRGEQFDVNVKLDNVSVGTTYHIRIYGGQIESSTDKSCLVDNLYNGNWLSGCGTDTSVMPYVSGDDNYVKTVSLRVGATSSSGTYYLYAYVPELNLTSVSRTIKINDPITPTPTTTPTLTLTPTLTTALTPTISLTPTPTLAPIIEPTAILEPTVVPIVVGTTESSDDSFKESKSFKDYLPIILVILGLIMFVGPVFVPKIIEKIKSKRRGPPQEPPQLLEHFKSQQPISVKEITFDE